ncbi:MAG: hypothetical protein WC785_00985 [Tatlockia sp.]|jgi:hypothetical protein
MGLTARMLNPASTCGSFIFFAVPEDKANENCVNLYVATGGELSSFFSTSISGGSNLLPKIEDSGSQLQHIINYITSCFTLTKDELAAISKIQSRKTLYNWADGTSKPRTLTIERLFDLFMIAKAWKQANLPSDYESLHYPIFKGVSIFDMLKSSSLDKEKILFAGSRIMLTRSNRTPLKDPFA